MRMEKYGVDKKSEKDDMEKRAEEKRQKEQKEKKTKPTRQHIKEAPPWASNYSEEDKEKVMDDMEDAAKELKSMFDGIFRG